jgi:hypothetical protein
MPFTDVDKEYCDLFLELGKATLVADAKGVSDTAVSTHLNKKESKIYIERHQKLNENKIAAQEMRDKMVETGKVNSLKTPEGLLAESIRMYESIPSPEFYKRNLEEQLIEIVETAVTGEKVDYAKLAQKVMSEIKKDLKINLDITKTQSGLYQNVAKYHKDFEEKKDEVFQELLLIGTNDLKERAKKNWERIQELTSGKY